jgi:enoyl-CoA hydratase
MASKPRFETLLLEREGAIAWITLNRPERLNALNGVMFDELAAALETERRSDSRVIVLRGAGTSFSAGHDLGRDSTEVVEPGDSVADRDRQAEYVEHFLRIWEHPKPVIAAVHGYCIAGASQLCTFCDLTIVAEDAVITASPMLPLGGGFISPLWAFLVGPKRAKHMSFVAGHRISGATAADWGWANFAVPAAALEGAVRELALAIARTPPSVLRMKKVAINRVVDLQGFRMAAFMGTESDVIVHETDAVESLKAAIQDLGLKEAIRRFEAGDL